MKEVAALLALIALSPALAMGGEVTLNFGAGQMLASDGSTPLATNSTLVLLADPNGDGFGDLTQATSSWTNQADDVLLARWGSNDLYGSGTTLDSILFDDAGVSVGDDLMLAWYDLAYDPAQTGPGNNVDFGTYRSEVLEDNGSMIAWEVPQPGTYDLYFLTEALGGGSPDSDGVAGLTTSGLGAVQGDLNGDLSFNINDLEPMLIAIADETQHDNNWPGVDQDVVGDFDSNGKVDINDLQPFLEALASSNAVPEPASLALLGVGGLALLRRRHGKNS